MKRLLSAILLGTITLVPLVGCGGPGTEFDGTNTTSSGDGKTLKVYNWGEYTGENLLQNFEEEFNCTVIEETFDSNEMMYTKLAAGDQYDVIVPSDYMIQRLLKEDMLQPLDYAIIENIDLLQENCLGLPYDPENEYSIPYFWGSVGIVYVKDAVSQSDLEQEGWEILRDTKYKNRIYMYDSERDSFMIALKALGYSMNTDDETQLNEAYEWLVEQRELVSPIYVTDEIIDNMLNENKDLGVIYSGDAAYILSENPNLGYYEPQQGTNIWSDAMVIPKNAANPELANEFINYVMTYEASQDNTETVGYTSANAEVFLDESSEGGMFYQNEAYIPRSNYEKDEVFEDNAVIRQLLSDLWIKVKAG
jgi:spermidine/putrescine-binding protein